MCRWQWRHLIKLNFIPLKFYKAMKDAVGNGHLEIVKLLLQDNRVDPSADNNRGTNEM